MCIAVKYSQEKNESHNMLAPNLKYLTRTLHEIKRDLPKYTEMAQNPPDFHCLTLQYFFHTFFMKILRVEIIFFVNQAAEIEELRERVAELTKSKEQLEFRNQKLADESMYAKGLASAAAVELKALSEEVAKLMNQNERLVAELAATKSPPTHRRTNSTLRNGRRETPIKRQDQSGSQSDIKRELAMSKERELHYEATLIEKDQREAELQSKIEESKQREAYLENELANMWVLVAKLKKSQGCETELAAETLRTDRFEI